MKRVFYIILIIVGSTICGTSQNTGFMGKHFLINVEAVFSPSWNNPNVMTQYDLSPYLGFNYFITPSIEGIVWKKGSVGAGYNFFNSDFINTIYTSTDSYIGTINASPSHLTAHGFHLYYKQYLGKTTAPLGQYLKLNFDAFFIHYTYDAYIGAILNSIQNERTALFGLKVEYGYDFLFFNCLRVSTALSLGTTFGGYQTPILQDGLIFEASSPNIPVEFAKTRILGAYWFGLKVGIGVLTF
ncbi:MAG: hypothetical protein RR356_02320 [Bacteroidales bacterium]